MADNTKPADSEWSWKHFTDWLMAHAALQKAAGTAPPPKPQNPGDDPYKYLRGAVQQGQNNLPLDPNGNLQSNNAPAPDPNALRVLGTPKRYNK